MSPRFLLAMLLVGFVLLGLSDAQRRQQQQQQQHNQPRYRTGGKYRNLGGDGSSGTDASPPPADCNPNNLSTDSGNSARRAKGRASGRSTAGGITDAPDNGDDTGPAGGIDCSKNQLASNNYDRFKKRT